MLDHESENSEKSAASAGLPQWVMTFADLMTLLMCFFVLLLSFSEPDDIKFKQLSGSMVRAFGVQDDFEAKTNSRGVGILAYESGEARPETMVIDAVGQNPVAADDNVLEIGAPPEAERETGKSVKDLLDQDEALAQDQAVLLRAALSEEIEQGSVIIIREGTDLVVQILERDSFASGSAELESAFATTLLRMGGLLNGMTGAITVSGHTDDRPISTSQYRSNWDLSVMRATTVAHYLLDAGIDPLRIMATGHAATQPRALNDSEANRALNRRIDITVNTSRPRHGFPESELAGR